MFLSKVFCEEDDDEEDSRVLFYLTRLNGLNDLSNYPFNMSANSSYENTQTFYSKCL